MAASHQQVLNHARQGGTTMRILASDRKNFWALLPAVALTLTASAAWAGGNGAALPENPALPGAPTVPSAPGGPDTEHGPLRWTDLPDGSAPKAPQTPPAPGLPHLQVSGADAPGMPAVPAPANPPSTPGVPSVPKSPSPLR
jgi:hypothetical protein